MTQQPDQTTGPEDPTAGDVVGDVTDSQDDSGVAGPGLGSPEKDPSDWVTGDEPATGPQASYLGTLAREAGVDVPEDLTKAQASEMIDDLQSRTGRGKQ
jgi:Protein of unknown function (DUF3072)